MPTRTANSIHAVPHRWYRAWWRYCKDCNTRYLSDANLTIRIRCNHCGDVMDQPPQHTPPDVETVTEWLTCDPDNADQWRCRDHREG
jgi:hypothetical protein